MKSLEDITGLRVVSVMGYPSAEFGKYTMTFQIYSIVLEHGMCLFVKGEHDYPYIGPLPLAGLSNDELLAAYNAEEEGQK